MRTISFINWKGGVGKTTLAYNTAYALGQKYDKNKVLFIDADKQGNGSLWFKANRNGKTFTDILLDQLPAEEVIQKTRFPNIDIIPSNENLLEANYAVLGNSEVNQVDILAESLKNVQDEYALCIIDCPPDINTPVTNCLVVTDDIVGVTLPNLFCYEGIKQLQEQLNTMNQDLYLNKEIMGIVINQVNPKDINNSICVEIKKKYKNKLLPSIRGGQTSSMYLNRAINNGTSILDFSPGCGFSQDFKQFVFALTKKIMKRMQEGK